MEIWEQIEDLVDDDCGFESHGRCWSPRTRRSSRACRARVDDLRLHGLHPRGADRRDRAAAAGAGGRRALPGRRGLAARRRGRSVPHDAGVPPQARSSAGAEVLEGVTRDRHSRVRRRLWRVETSAGRSRRPRCVNAAGAWADRIAAALGEPVPLETVAPMLMVTSRLPPFIEPVVILRGRKLSFKQLDNGTVRDRRRPSRHALSRPQRDGARLGEARDQRRAPCGSCSR